MPQSYILSKLKNVLSHSYFLNFLVRQVDVNEELKYESVITAWFYKPIVFLNSLLEWIANHTYIKALSERIDLKSVVIFVFIVSQVLFPGYGTENTGTALLPGSPVNSVGFKTGFYVSSLFFIIFFVGLIAVFIRDIIKKGDNLLFSKFEVILLFFIISIEISSSLSIYPTISFLWIIKFLRGIFVYYLVSRIIITRMNINTISYSYMTIIFIEFILSTLQFINGGPINLPIESASYVLSPKFLSINLLDNPILRPSGTLSHANNLSFLSSFSLPFIFILLFNDKKLIKVLSVIFIFLCTIISFITLSRWGLINLIFSTGLISIYFLFNKFKKIKINNVKKAFVLLIVLTLMLVFMNRVFIDRYLYFDQNDSSLQVRMELINQATAVIQRGFLFGSGGGTFAEALINYDYTPSRVSQYFPAPVHNLILLFLSETGFIATIIIILLLIYFLISFMKNGGKEFFQLNLTSNLIIIAVFVSISSYLFNGLWQIRTFNEHLSILFWFNLGLYFNILRNKYVTN